MSTEIREWINEIWEYCQENWAIMAAGAAVVVVFLVSLFLVLSAKREDARYAAMEAADLSEEPDLTREDNAEPVKDAERDEPVPEVILPAEPDVLTEAAEPAADTSVQIPESPVVLPTDRAAGVVEQLMKSVESASAASGQKVESIELKIEKARLTIRYAGASDVEPDFETEPAETGAAGEICSEEKEPGKESFAVRVQEEAEEPAAEESMQPKKFGVENMNRARSGRVYTEEELLNQIRD